MLPAIGVGRALTRLGTFVTAACLKEAIGRANSAYEQCWKYLCDVASKNFDATRRDCFIKFQPTLAEALFSLTKLYNQISLEKRALVGRKASLSPKWFRDRMQLLSRRQEVINDCISIGRSLGDAYVCFFYQNDRQHLVEHLSQQKIKYAPPGIGGRGELDFVKRFPVLNGCYVLYHGITNILRLGDVTLIDLSSLRVAGIGEIKSTPVDGKSVMISITVTATARAPQNGPDARVIQEPRAPSTMGLSQASQDRMNRQLSRIAKSMKRLIGTPSEHLAIESTCHTESLNTLVRACRGGRISYQRAGKGLLLVGYRPRSPSLLNRLESADADISARITKDLASHAQSIMDADRKDNSVDVGSLFYARDGESHYLPGMAHLFWWPIDLDVAYAIIFQKVSVLTIFNRAVLVGALERAGFTVREGVDRRLEISREVGGARFHFEGAGYYLTMIQQYLFDEQFVVDALVKSQERLMALNPTGDGRIELSINQQIGVPRYAKRSRRSTAR